MASLYCKWGAIIYMSRFWIGFNESDCPLVIPVKNSIPIYMQKHKMTTFTNKKKNKKGQCKLNNIDVVKTRIYKYYTNIHIVPA